MKTSEKVAVAGLGCLTVLGIALALVAPPLVREFRRVAAPLDRVKAS